MTGAAFLLLALALVAAAADWVAVHHENKRLEYVCKPLTMVLLVGAALALDPDDPAVRAWFVVALVLCLAGDVFLMLPAGPLRVRPGRLPARATSPTSSGMHVEGVEGPRFLVGIVIVMALLAVIGTADPAGRAGGTGPELAGPVVAYMFVISAMVASAIGVGHVGGASSAPASST